MHAHPSVHCTQRAMHARAVLIEQCDEWKVSRRYLPGQEIR
jgi:hypothetical protein